MKRKRETSRSAKIKRCEIKVFTGGSNSVQSPQFFAALDERITNFYQLRGIRIVVERIGVEQVRTNGWSIEEFVEWLSSGDIYIILSHPGQGISTGLNWDLSLLGDSLFLGLHGRIGFPRDEGLRCPVFTQDKFRYLDACRQVCIPSLQIWRTTDGELSPSMQAVVTEFCRSNFEYSDRFEADPDHSKVKADPFIRGWVMKAPFTTNGQGIKWCATFDSVLNNFKQFCDQADFTSVPYFIIQPRLNNRMEYKVVLGFNSVTNEEYSPYFAKHHLNAHPRKAFSLDHDLFKFAEEAKLLLTSQMTAVCSPVLRVDIMITQEGELVVNEFESLEALCDSCGQRQLGGARVQTNTTDMEMAEFKTNFWRNALDSLLEEYITNKSY